MKTIYCVTFWERKSRCVSLTYFLLLDGCYYRTDYINFGVGCKDINKRINGRRYFKHSRFTINFTYPLDTILTHLFEDQEYRVQEFQVEERQLKNFVHSQLPSIDFAEIRKDILMRL